MLDENKNELRRANLVRYQNMPKKSDLWYVVLDDTSKPREFDNIIVLDEFKQYFRTSDESDHNTNVCGVVRELLNDAKIITFPFFKSEEAQIKIIDWIIENQDKIAVVSLSATLTPSSTEIFERLNIVDIPIICASGNNHRTSTNSTASLPWTISAGAYDEHSDSIPDYSNGEVNMVAFSGIWIPTGQDWMGNPRYKWFNGTSCAAPFAGSMMWLYMTRMNVKFNRQQGFDFVHNNTMDILEEGFDVMSGYGLFVLPDINQTNMFIGSSSYKLDGVNYTMDSMPILQNNRTFVPIRFVAEALGCDVTWGGDIKGGNRDEIIIRHDDVEVNLFIGDTSYYINGVHNIMDVEPFLDENNRTLVPIRFVAEALGATVVWGGDLPNGNRDEVIIRL